MALILRPDRIQWVATEHHQVVAVILATAVPMEQWMLLFNNFLF
jgi:hypothetical protein